jgi:hypothetical protein
MPSRVLITLMAADEAHTAAELAERLDVGRRPSPAQSAT